MGIDFILFDLEDYGQESNNESWDWVLNIILKMACIRISSTVWDSLDMVGSNPGFMLKIILCILQRKLLKSLESCSFRRLWGSFPKLQGGGVMDDHYFVNEIAKIKMIDIINRPDGKDFILSS